jgi:hypothetical protein
LKLSDLKDSFVNHICVAFETLLGNIEQEFAGKSVYAMVLYGSNACRGLGAAISTREALADRNKKAGSDEDRKLLNMLDAAEWEYINRDYELFGQLDKDVRAIYDVFYDGQLDDINLDDLVDDELQKFISGFFVEAIVEAVNRLKDSKKMKTLGGANQLLLGVFTDDPCAEDLVVTERVSSKVNSSDWHRMVIEYCTLLNAST